MKTHTYFRFPIIGKIEKIVSNHWKNGVGSFQSLEKLAVTFPMIGNCVLGLILLLGCCFAGVAQAQTSYTNTIAVSRAAITNLMAEVGIPGCTVVLVDGQDVVWAEGFGWADKELKTPVTTNTVMAIGSVSKLLTAVMALQGMDEGVFDLDACITNYVTDFVMQPRFSGTPTNWTIRTMLDHHSGIPGDIYNSSFVVGTYWPGYTDWLIDYFQEDYPLYPPKTLASYCNSGFNVVGAAIARHDGVDFTEAAQNRLFGPLRMTYSSFLLDRATVTNNLATGYQADGSPAPVLVANMPATGGAYSRPLDMAQLIKMMLADGLFGTNRFLSTNALVQMGMEHAGPLDVDTFFRTGLGLDSVADPIMDYAGRTWLKNGSTGMFEALYEVLPDQQLGCFVNINFQGSHTFTILHGILTNAVREKSGLVPPVPTPMPVPAETNWSFAELQAIEGDYVTHSGVDRFAAQADGSLTCMRYGFLGEATTITNYRPHENGRFFVPGEGAFQLQFTNRAGVDAIVGYGDDGSERTRIMYEGYAESLYGARYTPPAISAAWSNRCGTFWLAEDMIYNSFFLMSGSPMGWMLTAANGLLTVMGNSAAVLAPTNDTLAYVAGYSTRGDGALRIVTNAAGQERLLFGGYRCVKMEDIPVLTNGAVQMASLSMHTNGLFMYAGAPGDQAAIVMGSNGADVVIRAVDLDSFSLLACGTGSVQWTCGSTPTLLTLSATNTIRIQLKAVDTTYLRSCMKTMLTAQTNMPGCAVAVQESGFEPLILAEGYAVVNPPSTNEMRALTGREYFHLASISKLYTAVSIMLLNERGMLELDQTCAQFVPELGVPRGGEITVDQLLEHRSGLPDANGTPWIDHKIPADRDIEFTVAEIVAVASNMYPNLLFDPGTDYHYTDTGYNILAAIVEKVSGRTFQAFVQTEVLDVLGLTNTFVPYNNQRDVPEPACHAYTLMDGKYEDFTRYNPSAELGCGSVSATLLDVMKFARGAFNSTNLLSAESRSLMMTNITDHGSDIVGRCIGYTPDIGWGHSGSMWGMNSFVAVDTNSGLTVAACNNVTYGEVSLLLTAINATYGLCAVAKEAVGQDAGPIYGMNPPIVGGLPFSPRQNAAIEYHFVSVNFPTNWVSDNLPDGLSLNAVNGQLTGRLAATGMVTFSVCAQNANGAVTNEKSMVVKLAFTNTIAKAMEQIEGAYWLGAFKGGSWVLVDGDEIVWSGGCGYADHAETIPATADTVYRIGSVSKLFSTVATLRECDRGRMDLDAPVRTYYNGLELEARADTNLPPINYTNNPITVRSLLNHLSGIPSTYMRHSMTKSPAPWVHSLLPDYLAEMLIGVSGEFACAPVNFFASYINNGFQVAEYLVSLTSGETLQEYAQTNIFMALGMDRTGYDMDAAAITNTLAESYDRKLEPLPKEYVNCLGSGGALSSANDMGAFIKMLLAGGAAEYAPVLQSGTVQEMMSNQTTGMVLNVGNKYFATGLGWDSALLPSFEYAGGGCEKNGETTTFAAYIALATNQNLGVFVAKNSPRASNITGLAKYILEQAILEKSGVARPDPAVIPPSDFVQDTQTNVDALAGSYVNNAGVANLKAGTNCLLYGGAPQYLRADGWYGATTNAEFLIGFTNVEGRLYSKIRMEYDGYVETAVTGMRYEPPVITNAWTNRMDCNWLIRSLPPESYLRTHPSALCARTWMTNGLYMLSIPAILLDDYSHGDYGMTDVIIEPYDDDVAFVQGVGGKMPCGVFSDDENMMVNSYYWKHVTSIPHITMSTSTNFAPYPLMTDWFSFDAEAGTEYFLNLGSAVTGVFMLADAEGRYLGDGSQDDVLRWTCPTSGVYYAGINFPMDVPPEVAVSFYNYTNTIEQMTTWVTNMMTTEQITGLSIALLDDQDVVWAEGFGYADQSAGRLVSTDTVFRIGSCSKAFTAAAAMHYVEQGGLNLEEPVSNYLPQVSWLERYPAADAVTIRDMLNMHSGLPGDMNRGAFTTEPISNGYSITTNELAQTYPIYPPNYIWDYSNIGFTLMEGVLEALATNGQSFTTLAEETLFTPLGMSATSFLKDKTAISNELAYPYYAGIALPEEFVNIYATGGMYSRPTDMLKFLKALFAGGSPILTAPSVQTMQTPQATNVPLDAYKCFRAGLGWDFVDYPYLAYAGPCVGKNGGTMMYSAQMAYLSDHKLAVALVVNGRSATITYGALEALRHAVQDKARLTQPDLPPFETATNAAVSQAALDALTGVYVGSDGYDSVLAESNKTLTYIHKPYDPAQMQSISNLILRTNGWFMTDADVSTRYCFTNCAGVNFMAKEELAAGYVKKDIQAVRFETGTVSAAWLARTGQAWVVKNETVSSYFRVLKLDPTLQLKMANGVLLAHAGVIDPVTEFVLVPTNDTTAFVYGLKNRTDSALQVKVNNGETNLLFAGYVFEPEPESTTGTVSLAGSIDSAGDQVWYKLTADGTHSRYLLNLSGVPTDFVVRVYAADKVTVLKEGAGGSTLSFASEQNPLYITVQPSVTGSQTGAFSLNVNYRSTGAGAAIQLLLMDE